MKLQKNQIIKLEQTHSGDTSEVTGKVHQVEDGYVYILSVGKFKISDWKIEVIKEAPVIKKLPFCFIIFSPGENGRKRCVMNSSNMQSEEFNLVGETAYSSFNELINSTELTDDWSLFQKTPHSPGFHLCSGYFEYDANDYITEGKIHGAWTPIKADVVEIYHCDKHVKDLEEVINK